MQYVNLFICFKKISCQLFIFKNNDTLNNFDNTIFFKRFITQIACQDHFW